MQQTILRWALQHKYNHNNLYRSYKMAKYNLRFFFGKIHVLWHYKRLRNWLRNNNTNTLRICNSTPSIVEKLLMGGPWVSYVPSIVEKLLMGSPSVSYVYRVPSLIIVYFCLGAAMSSSYFLYYTEKKTHFTAANQCFQQSNNNITIYGPYLIATATLIPFFFKPHGFIYS